MVRPPRAGAPRWLVDSGQYPGMGCGNGAGHDAETANAVGPPTVANAEAMDLTQEEDDSPPLSQHAYGSSSSGNMLSAGTASGLDNLALAQLAEMGFSGSVAARALKAAGGDVQEALSRLLYRASVL